MTEPLDKVRIDAQDALKEETTEMIDPQTKMILGGILCLFAVWFLALLATSPHTWFHLGWASLLGLTMW